MATSFKEVGTANTESFRLAYEENNKAISPWHDIDVYGKTAGTVNMVVEIPRYTLAKMEVHTLQTILFL